MKLLQNLFDFERTETAGEILLYRCLELFVVFWVIRYAWRWGLYILKIGGVVQPTGVAAYVDVSFMFSHDLALVNAAVISLLVLAGYFRLFRHAYLAALLLMHLQYAARFCLGKVSHSANLIGMTLLAMGLAALAFEHRHEIRRAALGLCYFFVGLAYTSAALCKLIGTGPHWVDGRHLWLWIGERTLDTFSTTGVLEYNAVQVLALGSHALATLLLTFGFLAELFGFTVWLKRFRPFILTLLIGMHVGIDLSMQISFRSNLYLLLLLAYPWAGLIDAALQRLDAAWREKVRALSLKLA